MVLVNDIHMPRGVLNDINLNLYWLKSTCSISYSGFRFQANKLSVNATKTNYMVLGTPQNTRNFIDINQNIDKLNDSELTRSSDVEKVKLNIKLDGVSLNRVCSTKFFGVIIDRNLT